MLLRQAPEHHARCKSLRLSADESDPGVHHPEHQRIQEDRQQNAIDEFATIMANQEEFAVILNHLDLSEPEAPAVWIRYGDARHHHKERQLKLDAAWPRVLEEYKVQYDIEDKLFPCTARNLEYVLRDVSQLAVLPKQVSFEMLRWTCAVRDSKSGMSTEQVRHKLGLSKITWEETKEKLARLTAPAI
jgi:hypothetical protein